MNKLTPERINDILDMQKGKPLNTLTIEFDNDGDIESITLNDVDQIDRIDSINWVVLHDFIESLKYNENEKEI